MANRREFLKSASLVPLAGIFPGGFHQRPCGATWTPSPAEYLRETCKNNLAERYAGTVGFRQRGKLTQSVLCRLDRELSVIEETGLVDYFLHLGDLGRFARTHGILLNLRGRAGGSLVCYALHLSDVCPLRQNLLFELFLRKGAPKAAPIQIECCDDHRQQLVNYLEEACSETLVALPNNIQRRTLSGLKSLTILSRALALVHEKDGTKVDLQKIPLDDKAALALLARGDTEEIFQLQSRKAREFLRCVKPDCFEDLIAVNALYRPEPYKQGITDAYMSAKHGNQARQDSHPLVWEILKETYGVIVYREQAFDLLTRLGGMSTSEALITFKTITDGGNKVGDRFIARVQHGCGREVARQIFEQIKTEVSWSFRKSHSAGHALIAYRMAYLKAHFPEGFLRAVHEHETWRRAESNRN